MAAQRIGDHVCDVPMGRPGGDSDAAPPPVCGALHRKFKVRLGNVMQSPVCPGPRGCKAGQGGRGATTLIVKGKECAVPCTSKHNLGLSVRRLQVQSPVC